MKKLFIITEHVKNGTVTMQTHTSAYANRELAEKMLERAERRGIYTQDQGGFRVSHEGIKEITLYESIDDMPFLKNDEPLPPSQPAISHQTIVFHSKKED